MGEWLDTFKGILFNPDETVFSFQEDTKRVSVFAGINFAVIFGFLILGALFTMLNGLISGYSRIKGVSDFFEYLNLWEHLKLIIGLAVIMILLASILFLFGRYFQSNNSFKNYYSLSFLSTYFIAFYALGSCLSKGASLITAAISGGLDKLLTNMNLGYGAAHTALSNTFSIINSIMNFGNFLLGFFGLISVVLFGVCFMIILAKYYNRSIIKSLFMVVVAISLITLFFSVLGIVDIFNPGILQPVSAAESYLNSFLGLSSFSALMLY